MARDIKLIAQDYNTWAKISGVTIIVDGVDKTTNSAGEVIFQLEDGYHAVTLSKQGYEYLSTGFNSGPLATSYLFNLRSSGTATPTVTPPSTRNIKLIVQNYNTWAKVSGASISVSGIVKITDSNGEAIFQLNDGAHIATITKSGYEYLSTGFNSGPLATSYVFNLRPINAPTPTTFPTVNPTNTPTVTPVPIRDIRLIVQDYDTWAKVSGANVNVSGTIKITDTNGEVIFQLRDGAYSATITKSGYEYLSQGFNTGPAATSYVFNLRPSGTVTPTVNPTNTPTVTPTIGPTTNPTVTPTTTPTSTPGSGGSSSNMLMYVVIAGAILILAALLLTRRR